jgi:hypothetical protein
MKRYFVYSAVTQFDATNTTNDSVPYGGAESWVTRTGFLRTRMCPVRFPRIFLIIFRVVGYSELFHSPLNVKHHFIKLREGAEPVLMSARK